MVILGVGWRETPPERRGNHISKIEAVVFGVVAVVVMTLMAFAAFIAIFEKIIGTIVAVAFIAVMVGLYWRATHQT